MGEENVKIFADTLNYIFNSGHLDKCVQDSVDNSRVYFEDEWPIVNRPIRSKEADISVSGDRSFEAARILRLENPDSRIAVLNFANGVVPGGGVLNGASAQEESLCRISTLYPVILDEKLDCFYRNNEDIDPLDSTDSLIYSKDIVVFKSDTERPELLPKSDWYKVDVITMAAPDLGYEDKNPLELYSIHFKRAMHMLTCAASEGSDILVLGAFGCGAFMNDPVTVAGAWFNAIKVFPKVFDKIEFAVYKGADPDNYEIFKEVFG